MIMPIPPSLLKSTLCNDMTPSDWYRFLNGFVFLWANEDRLLADLGHQVFLSPINSGNARRNAVARSRTIFTSYHDWLSKGWPIIGSQQRPRSSSPAEVVVKGHLPLNPYLINEYHA